MFLSSDSPVKSQSLQELRNLLPHAHCTNEETDPEEEIQVFGHSGYVYYMTLAS